MVHDWILDVLTDLREFAEKNGLSLTERQINQAIAVVAKELDAGRGLAQGMAHIGHVGKFSGSVAAGRDSR